MHKDERAARYLPPDKIVRAQHLAGLCAVPAMPLTDVGLLLDIPPSTIQELRRKGEGPRTFKIGRRHYVRQSDLREWLDALAQSDAS